MKEYPLSWYGVRRGNAKGVQYNPKQCAGEMNQGFGSVIQCRHSSGHGERGIFCERHKHLKAKPEAAHAE